MKLHFLPVLVLAASALAGAQAPGGGTVTQASIGLLADPAVRKEIKLTKAQDTEVVGEFKRLNDTLRNIPQPKTATEMRAAQEKARSMQLSLVSRLQARLNASQAKRLREVALQFFGPFSMLSPEIQKELGMTAAQVSKVKAAQKNLADDARKLQESRQKEVKAIPEPKNRNDQKAVQDYVKKVQTLLAKYGPSDQKKLISMKKAAEAKAVASLSSAQQGKWKSMLGAKFTPPKKTA
ncbi:MAG TPA: hypothetical protein PLX06_08790 [Fimbriimonadaceae bacterium]|nr:hypothetical protein [Fimbriimonadaceae bacterium]